MAIRIKRKEVNLAFVAGLFEGEGNFNAFQQLGRNGVRANHAYIQASIGMHERDIKVLQKAAKTLGYGTMYGPYNNHTVYLKFTSINEVAALAADLWKWLSIRRKNQYLQAVKLWRKYHDAKGRETQVLKIVEIN